MIKKYPTTARFILAAILFALAIFLSDLLGKQIHFPYWGTILFVLVTWILYKTDNKTLQDIGLNLRIRNISFLVFGLFLGILGFAIATWSRTLYTGENWHLNQTIDWIRLAKGLWIVLPTVATQQILFRGYLYKKTLEKSNLLIANLIGGAAFVSYHDIWGNLYYVPFMVISLFLAHYMFASALLKSATLYFPIGIHLAHNWSTEYFAGYKPTDKAIFYLTDQQMFSSFQSSLIFWFTYNLGFILLAVIFWRWKRVKTVNSVETETAQLTV